MDHIDNLAKVLELENYSKHKYISLVAEKTKQKPERVVLFLILLILCFLLFTQVGQMVVLYLIGFFYPVYKSYLALETVEDHDDKRWLTYWVVFGFIMSFSFFFELFMDYLPMPRILTSIFFFVLYCPLTNGYEYIYNFVIKKILKSYEIHVDKYI